MTFTIATTLTAVVLGLTALALKVVADKKAEKSKVRIPVKSRR